MVGVAQDCCSASGNGNTFASVQQFICDCGMDVDYKKNVLLFVTFKTLMSSRSIGLSWFQACLAIADLSSSHAVSSPCGCLDEDCEVSFHLSFVRTFTVTLDFVQECFWVFILLQRFCSSIAIFSSCELG